MSKPGNIALSICKHLCVTIQWSSNRDSQSYMQCQPGVTQTGICTPFPVEESTAGNLHF